MDRRSRFEDPRFGALVAALRVVAAEADAQGRDLGALREVADGMSHSEPMSSFGHEVAELELPRPVQSLIEAIDLAFEELVGDLGAASLSKQVLELDPRWARIRELAREALDELGLTRPGR